MKWLVLITITFALPSCEENKMKDTPQKIREEAKRKEDSTVKAWEHQILKELSAASLSHSITLEEFLSKIRHHRAVKGAQMMKSGFIYISVTNNGNNKTPVATYLCRMAKRFGIKEVKGIKIIDAADARFHSNQTASGTELGISVCNFINP